MPNHFIDSAPAVRHPHARPTNVDVDLDLLDAEQLRALVRELESDNVRLRRDITLFLDHASDGYWDWYIAEDYEYMSPRFWEILGVDPATKRHHPSEWQALIDPDDLPSVLERFEAHVETRGVVPFDQNVRYRHADGRWVTVRCRGRVIEWSSDGQPVRMVGTHTDLTSTLESSARERLIYGGAQLGIWEWPDVERDVLDWNPQLFELFGYEEGEFVPTLTRFRSMLHPEDVDRTFALVRAHFDTGTPYDVEYRVRAKNGEYHWYHAFGTAVRDADGRPRRMTGAVQDIDYRKQVELKLLELGLRQTVSFAASGIGVWDLDVTKGVLTWDDRMWDLYGVRESDFDSPSEARASGMHPDDRAEIDTLLQRTLESEGKLEIQHRVIRPDGEVRTLRKVAVAQKDESGTAHRLIGVCWDITETQRALEALERTNEDLTQFAYRTSHDLKAPLASIRGVSVLLREDLEEGELEEAASNIDRIHDEATRLVALVDDMLELTRSELTATEFESVRLPELLASIVDDVRAVDATREVRFEIECDDEVPHHLPRIRVSQILTNLVSNGAKYADPECTDPLVRVRASIEGRLLVLEVADNGVGIPEEFHRAVGDAFTRFHPDRATGSGLGLAIVKRHVDRLGGDLRFESRPGDTCFHVTVPIPDPRAATESTSETPH